MCQDVGEELAESVLVRDALTRAVFGSDIEAILVESAKEFFVCLGSFASERAAIFGGEIRPEVETGRVFPVKPFVVFFFGDQKVRQYLPRSFGGGTFHRHQDAAIGPIIVGEKLAKVSDRFHLLDRVSFQVFQTDDSQRGFVGRF